MEADNALRDRFVNYFGFSEDDEYAKMEKVRRAVNEIAPMKKRIREAVKSGAISSLLTYKEQIDAAVLLNYISEEEAQQMHAAEALRWDAIQVDEFDEDLNQVVN